MAELEVAVVSVIRRVWVGRASRVIVKTTEGDMGVLPGHEPVLAMLVDGPLRVETVDGDTILFAVHGGFFSVDSNRVNVMVEYTEMAQEIDLDRARAALERAESSDMTDPEHVAAVRRAETRIAVGVGRG